MIKFMSIFVVIFLAWGVAQMVLLYDPSPTSLQELLPIIFLPFFQIFAKIYGKAVQSPPFNMAKENDDCTNEPELYSNYTKVRCSDRNTNWIAMIFLMGYLLLSNLLLINLLVAIFSQTFAKIEGICDFILLHE